MQQITVEETHSTMAESNENDLIYVETTLSNIDKQTVLTAEQTKLTKKE